ncbi:hypothetical protein A9Q93_12415 [Nonlabens dokdonensis]|mgnify:CR=1 FL=1|uniref:Putative beta-lactamase-inhibitor-like PepSY-like domain-containing protein n=1 Tax=Nonlabens dokdonensis TaxID=328515 RepID=A0A1Z8AKI9_9FLAO|nr:PepSY-like domain-containing protein [Nonlabens dokdonensis]OUS10839.1 hypothetical protein A9Q93_12415 [Nonlabens dokdonensis]
MKHISFILVSLFLSLTASCQNIKNSKAPKAVVDAFTAKYPNEHDPDFEQDAHGYWEAHFKKNGEKYRADFYEDGTWRETENSIKYKELPKAVKQAIKNEYSDREITEIEHVLSAAKGEFYDVEFKQKGKNMDVEYRKNGTKLKDE